MYVHVFGFREEYSICASHLKSCLTSTCRALLNTSVTSDATLQVRLVVSSLVRIAWSVQFGLVCVLVTAYTTNVCLDK